MKNFLIFITLQLNGICSTSEVGTHFLSYNFSLFLVVLYLFYLYFFIIYFVDRILQLTVFKNEWFDLNIFQFHKTEPGFLLLQYFFFV